MDQLLPTEDVLGSNGEDSLTSLPKQSAKEYSNKEKLRKLEEFTLDHLNNLFHPEDTVNVFGAPTYINSGHLFDHLDFMHEY